MHGRGLSFAAEENRAAKGVRTPGICRPYGTRIQFWNYPALRLRLRAGL